MRKTIAVLLVIGLALAAAAAPAEGAVRVEEHTVADFGDFTVTLEPGAIYAEAQREPGRDFLIVLPRNETPEDSELAFSVFWYGPFSTEGDSLAAMRDTVMDTGLANLENAGVKVYSRETGDPAEGFLQGMPCAWIDATYVYELTADIQATAIQRMIFVGDRGYVFIVSGSSPERLEESLALMESMLAWK